ncbi:Zn-dependent protease with chaperone function [Corynebacterium mustelae]|uniref:Zn-dependent protease with chaperone function n=1 Tax=Corynebacterium mustelae TaxID=571915 RepID=A0A0G3H0E8_9CORY|nr:M48 family metallopeptidase [Corynebacterium mustelae]AKK06876.1 Zn-dependent protease with chaperone function [Corynebacterium mustelae]
MSNIDAEKKASKFVLSSTNSELALAEKAVPTIREFRHKAEIPMLVLGIILTLLAAIVCIYLVFDGETLSDFGTGILIGLAAPLILFFGIRWTYWNTITNAVEVTPIQFPEVYKIYQEITQKMGFVVEGESINRRPRLYITNGNGVMNAFASKCQVRKGYVVMHSDIVDVGYIHGDWGFIRFVLAHELGHIKCGHVDLWRSIMQPITMALFLEPTVTRAQEYTADRVACYFAPEGGKGMIHLYCGKHLGHKVNLDEYFESVSKHQNSFWVRVVNFFSSHAVGFRRMAALKEAETKGWDVHGKML